MDGVCVQLARASLALARSDSHGPPHSLSRGSGGSTALSSRRPTGPEAEGAGERERRRCPEKVSEPGATDVARLEVLLAAEEHPQSSAEGLERESVQRPPGLPGRGDGRTRQRGWTRYPERQTRTHERRTRHPEEDTVELGGESAGGWDADGGMADVGGETMGLPSGCPGQAACRRLHVVRSAPQSKPRRQHVACQLAAPRVPTPGAGVTSSRGAAGASGNCGATLD